MKNKDVLIYAFNEMKHQRLRTWLTLLGIIIGSFALFSVLTASHYVKTSVMGELSKFGADNIMIMPFSMPKKLSSFISGPSKMGRLYNRDVSLLKSVSGIKTISGFIYGKATIIYKGKAVTGLVSGGNSNAFDIFSTYLSLKEGRYFTNSEHNVVVLGYTAANTMFGKKVNVGNHIIINGRSFRVVGIMKKISTTFSNVDDSAIYIPIADAREIFSKYIGQNELSAIILNVGEGYKPSEVKKSIQSLLDISHKTNKDNRDYTVMTQEFMNKMIGQILDTIDFFLILIAIITAGISAFGIANTMYTSIVERTKEIGTLKAIGAKNNDIQKIFLTESMLFSTIGGIIGIGIVLLLIVVTYLFTHTLVIPDIISIIIVLLFSLAVGFLSGYFPAKRASEIDPVRAINS